jgi:hypothetical protein
MYAVMLRAAVSKTAAFRAKLTVCFPSLHQLDSLPITPMERKYAETDAMFAVRVIRR